MINSEFGIHSLLKLIGEFSRWGGNPGLGMNMLKELCHESIFGALRDDTKNGCVADYRGNRQQTEWNMNTTLKTLKEGNNITANPNGGTVGKTWKKKRIAMGISKTCQFKYFQKFIFVVCKVWHSVWETNLFDKKLWFCCSQSNFSSSVPDSRETAPLIRV